MDKVNINRLIVFTLALYLGSCSPRDLSYKSAPKHIREHFTLCYSEINKFEQHKIKTDGYYHKKVIYNRMKYGIDSITYDTMDFTIVFSDDGFMARQCGALYDSKDSIEYNIGCVEDGLYDIIGDTLITEYLNFGSWMRPWHAWRKKYFILDSATIIQFYSYPIHKMDKDYIETLKPIWKKKYDTLKFVPSKAKLSFSTSYLKNSDWIWCNEEEYLQSIKTKKK